MDLWEAVGLLGILALWGAIGLIPWFVALVARRGQGAFVALPIAVAASIAGGALMPALGGKDAFGFGISLLAALATSAAASMLPPVRIHRRFISEG